ncbi:MAG: hypothetical protein KF906_11680 [Actinobacteria bacterium]|nr:hypothetical protein [Actinomycetota bacterium]
MSDDERAQGPGEDPRASAGVEHLQRAAREMIAASRAFLDVVEDLVDRPEAVQDLIDTVGALGGRAGRAVARRDPGGDGEDDDPGEPPVQRIPVS